MSHPIDNIATFMELGGQIVPHDTDRTITGTEYHHFIDRIVEEINETSNAYSGIDGLDFPEALDGAIDTAYVALTLAIRLVGANKAREAWDAVVDANLAKVDTRHGATIINPETGKIGKPKGWTAPDIEAIVNA